LIAEPRQLELKSSCQFTEQVEMQQGCCIGALLMNFDQGLGSKIYQS
jgi:hypothetical protein